MQRPIRPTAFDWDKGNKDKNWLKHRVSFAEAEEVFFQKPILFFVDEGHSEKEKRLLAYGKSTKNRWLTIVFTVRNKKIRIISARDQSRKERRIYEKK